VNARTASHAKLLVVALFGVVMAVLPSAALPDDREGRCDDQGVVLSLEDRPSHHSRYGEDASRGRRGHHRPCA
jgi:hypothetical protein